MNVANVKLVKKLIKDKRVFSYFHFHSHKYYPTDHRTSSQTIIMQGSYREILASNKLEVKIQTEKKVNI